MKRKQQNRAKHDERIRALIAAKEKLLADLRGPVDESLIRNFRVRHRADQLANTVFLKGKSEETAGTPELMGKELLDLRARMEEVISGHKRRLLGLMNPNTLHELWTRLGGGRHDLLALTHPEFEAPLKPKLSSDLQLVVEAFRGLGTRLSHDDEERLDDALDAAQDFRRKKLPELPASLEDAVRWRSAGRPGTRSGKRSGRSIFSGSSLERRKLTGKTRPRTR